MNTDIEIARAARKRPIAEIAAKLGIGAQDILPYGHDKAKISRDFIAGLAGRPQGRLILVTAINPTPAGEGKTTTTVGLGDALNRLGARATICIREASLGPNFGMKGGAAGGGRAQVIPMEDMNLHFTGDFHAITSAHNLLSAMLDNHLHWGNALDIDPRRISWRRVLDMNDRVLRDVVLGLGPGNGVPRESGFDITVASEVMAILCLSRDLADLQDRLGRIVVAQTRDGRPVTARDLQADGAMTVLLRDALQPNLVQTLENNPALVHGGPFANIAHGCNSVIATTTALHLSDYVVTEAGFGADLGAEKFLNIKCRKAGLAPAAVVLVATARGLKIKGGGARPDLGVQNGGGVEWGAPNPSRHIRNLRKHGLPLVVAINHFATDTRAEIAAIEAAARALGVQAITCRHWEMGGAGAEDLAREVMRLAAQPHELRLTYPDDMPLRDKIETICTRIYGAEGAQFPPAVLVRLDAWQAEYGHLPVCMAKTQYSFSANPDWLGAPEGFTIPVRELRLAAGAGFVVAICGDIMTMPGLPRDPAANRIRLGAGGHVEGLF